MSPSTGASARRAGHTFERDVARYLGVRTTRSVRPGIHDDAGDLVVDEWLLELKNYGHASANRIARWHTEARVKARAARLDHVAVVIKARNQPLPLSRVYLTASDLYGLIADGELDDPTLVAIDLYSLKAHFQIRGVLS